MEVNHLSKTFMNLPSSQDFEICKKVYLRKRPIIINYLGLIELFKSVKEIADFKQMV